MRRAGLRLRTILVPKAVFKALEFRVLRDKKYILVAEPKFFGDPAAFRLTAGGLLVWNGSNYAQVMPFNNPPSPPAWLPIGFGIPYNTGIVFYFGNNTAQYLAQLDAAPFLLIRSILGVITVPLPPGVNYQTNGTVSGGQVSLAGGQYVVFYTGASAPAIGTYLATNVEQGTGATINLITTSVTIITFKTNMGGSDAPTFAILGKLDTTNTLSPWPLSLIRYPDGNYRPPQYPILNFMWEARDTQLGVVVGSTIWGAAIYGDDPNTGTWAWMRRAIAELRIYTTNLPAGFNYGMGIRTQHYDSTNTYRYDLRLAYFFNTAALPFKVRIYNIAATKSTMFNYDQGGATTGFSITSIPRPTNPEYSPPNRTISLYNGAWGTQTLVSNYWTWLDGYWAFESVHPAIGGLAVPNAGDTYVYGKYIYAGSNQAPTPTDGHYRYSNWYQYAADQLYFFDWADTTIPNGWQGGEACEFWYNTASSRENTPAKPTFDNTLAWAPI